MTIPEMLNRLAEKAPDVCKCNPTEDDPEFSIGEFGFFFMDDKLCSSTHDIRKKRIYVEGCPALAWLADAIMGECKKRNISLEHTFWTYDGKQLNRVHDIISKQQFVSTHSYAEALLAAFLAAVEGKSESN